MSVSLYLRMFGSPQCFVGGKLLDGFTYSRARALVYYLGTTNRSHAREALATLLWNTTDAALTNKSLRNVLTDLRQQLGNHLQISRYALGPAPDSDWQVESRIFETLLQPAQTAEKQALSRLRRAVSLYRGEFLDGFFVAGASAFNEWVEAERLRLRTLALSALTVLTEAALEKGHYLEGITFANRHLDLDPWNEDTHRLLLLLLERSGQRSAAVKHYQSYCANLYRELGVEPVEETQELVREIARKEARSYASTTLDAPIPAQPHVTPVATVLLPFYQTPLIGREAELAQVELLLQRGQQLVTITGLGGSGKTRLAVEIATRLATTASPAGAAPGILFIPLDGLMSPGMPHDAVKAALSTQIAAQLDQHSDQDTPAQVFHRLAEFSGVIILDYLDTLPAGSAVVVELLRAAPRSQFIVTSRSRLHIHGEHIVWLRGLAFPDPNQPITVVDGEHYPALTLFLRTAQAFLPTLALNSATLALISRICQQVDGLPLAVELAANLLQLMSCSEIAGELEDDFSILQTAGSYVLPRQSDLWAVFKEAWDYPS